MGDEAIVFEVIDLIGQGFIDPDRPFTVGPYFLIEDDQPYTAILLNKLLEAGKAFHCGLGIKRLKVGESQSKCFDMGNKVKLLLSLLIFLKANEGVSRVAEYLF